MDSQEVLKERYAEEAKVYRKEALQVNFDAEVLFPKLLQILNKVFPGGEINILDVGAGNGMLTELVFKEFPNAKYTMLDFSKEMLDSAESYFKDNNLNIDVEYVVSDFIKDAFPNKKYDLIISSYALHHIREVSELKNVYKKIADSLKSTGWFLCVDLFLGNTEEEIQEQVAVAIKSWSESFNSIERAYEWGKILRGEDSPATLGTIFTLLNECSDTTTLLIRENGLMATIYGLTKEKNLEVEKELEDVLIFEKGKKTIDKSQYKIGYFPFPEK